MPLIVTSFLMREEAREPISSSLSFKMAVASPLNFRCGTIFTGSIKVDNSTLGRDDVITRTSKGVIGVPSMEIGRNSIFRTECVGSGLGRC